MLLSEVQCYALPCGAVEWSGKLCIINIFRLSKTEEEGEPADVDPAPQQCSVTGVQCSVMQCGAVQHSAAYYSAVQLITVQ